ncbi:MAG: gamma-glutamyltransferase [Phycisphaerales bacterium]|nr:gamma-glutamyltransferase [Phycisphaerales bacterium]
MRLNTPIVLAAACMAIFTSPTSTNAFAEEQRPSAPGLPRATRSEAYAPKAMAATSHPLATQIALDVMRRGGTAVDGAIAANAAIGLMEPTGSGIGGDLFAIVWDPKAEGGKGKLFGYNGSGRSPKAMTIEFVKSKGVDEIPPLGPLPVTVPGCVDGWFALHGKFGKLGMSDVLAPAIGYAENGFPMAPVIADAWAISVRRLEKFPNFKEQFTIDGRAPKAGEIWKNPNLARTLTTIAQRGRDGYYKGEVGSTIASFLQSQGGAMTADDLAAHTGEWVEPVSANYRGYDVWEIPPNGQGIAALQILKVLEGFDLQSMGFGSADYIHTFVEAKKLAFEDRARYYADQAFAKVPVKTLISAEYAAERRKNIDPAKAALAVEPGAIPTGADTIYMTVADESGMMVSLIQSNYRGMGSGMVPPGLGFMLQDRGEQFALVESHPNSLQGGKRPFHTIIPAFVTKDGKPWMSFGVMGGAMQPQGHAQIIVNLIDFGMTLQQAGDAPRIHHDGSTEPQGAVKAMSTGGVLNLEPGFAPEVLAELEKRGHVIKPAPTAVFGGYQAIRRDAKTGVYEGASESRKDGMAAGY